MKKLLLLACLAFFGMGCKKEKRNPEPEMLAYHEINNEQYKHIYGYWVGYRIDDYAQMEKDTTLEVEEEVLVSLKINRIVNNTVYGLVVQNGVTKPVTGQCKAGNHKLLLSLKEPSTMDDPGFYEFTLKNDTLRGVWEPYNKRKGRMSKNIELVKRVFKYDSKYMLSEDTELVDWDDMKEHDTIYKDEDGNDYKTIEQTYRNASDEVFKYNASVQKLTEDQLKNLRKLDLEIIRNTIFARHGYSFKRSSLRTFFEAADWYVPVSNNVDKELTSLEKQNIALLKRMEAYAADHYDAFGR